MQAIARARKQTWRSWRQRILKIFEAIRPDLEAYDARQEFRRTRTHHRRPNDQRPQNNADARLKCNDVILESFD
jgi:hypothetical protein